jgi:predicted RNase H-like HicB family nuclease
VVSTKIAAGSNIIANSSFENLNYNHIASAGCGVVTNTPARTGTRSIKLVGGTGYPAVYLTVDNAGRVEVPCSEGDVFLIEYYAKGASTNSLTHAGSAFIQLNVRKTDSTFGYLNVPVPKSNSNQWVKVSGYVTIPPLAYSFYADAYIGPNTQVGTTYWIDDVVLREVTEGSVAKANAGAADTKAQATVDNVVESVSGVVSTGNTPASVKTSLQDAWTKFWEGLTGNTGSNKLPSDVKSGATLVKTKSDDAFRDAGLADGKAVKAKNAAGISIASGSNLVANASFENFDIPVVGQWAYSTEQARTGTRSAKLTSNGSSNQAVILGTDGDGAELDILCSPGDIFYVEAWIRGAGTNTATTGSFYISSRFRKKHPTTGVVTLEYLNGGAVAPDIGALKNGWVKISGYVTAPADSYGYNPLVIVGSNIAASNHWYVDDVTVREVTTAQATLDNIVQSVTGVTATGNSPVNAQNKLVDAWTEFWRGLNKDQTGTNKRPTDVNTAAAGLRDRANDAFNKGSDAEGKAIVGQRITKSYIESGSNVLPNPGFENTAFFGNELYSLEQQRTGLRSLKMTATGAIQDVTISTDSDSIVSIKGEGGEIYYYEYWMRGGSTVASGQAGLHLRCVSDTGAASFVNGYATITTANRNTWGTKYSGYLTLPPSTATFTVVMSVRANVPSGHVLYFDDVVVREVTSAAAINQNLYGQNTPGATIPEGKVEYLPTVRTTANTAQSVASALVASGGNLLANSSFESTSFFLAAVQGSYSTEQARTGTRSLKIISNASSAYGYVTSDLTGTLRIPASAGDIFYVEFYVRGADLNAQTTGGTNGIRLVINFRNAANGSAGSAVVNQLASTALDNVWTKVSGYTTASPAPAGTVGFYAYLELTGAVTSGETYYFDDVVIQRVTEGVAADTKAQATADNIVQSVAGGGSTGNSPATVQTQLVNAWTAFWQGLKKNTPESTETNKRPADVKTAAEVLKTLSDDAFRDAGTADGKAVLAQNNLNVKSKDFTNLLPGSDFESTTQLWPVSLAPATFSIITGVAGVETNTGTKSLRIVGGDTAQRSITFDSVSPNFEVKQGDQIYMELWVRESDNYANTDTSDPRFRCIRGTGSVSAGSTIGDIKLLPANIPTAETWTKLSLTVTIPAGVPAVQFVFTGPKTSPAMTGTLWVDDIVVRRVTKADEVVRLPATKVAGLPTIGSNICPNNSFEESTFWAGATMFSTEQARTGTRSLKMVANAANQDYWVINDGVSQISRITASPGDSFYIEFWVYGASHNTGTGTISMFITPYTNVNATLTSPGFNYTLSTANKGVWTKVSGTVTIPTSLTTAASISARVRLASNVPVNTSPTLPDTYYFDDFIIREVTVAQATADNIVQSVAGGSSTGNSPASVQTQLVNAWTQFWRGLAKDQTGTDKRPADVNVAAAGVLEIAEDGVRDADAAKGRAIAINQTLFGQDLPGTSIAETRIPTLSLQKIPTLTEDKLPTISQGKVSGLTTDLTGNASKIQSTVDKIAGALTGGDTVDALVDDAAAALRKTYLTLSDHSRQIQTFITDKTSSAVKGAAFNVDFDSYANGAFPDLGANSNSFAVTYNPASGSTNLMGVQNGVAQWYNTANSNRDAKIIWQKSTNTDFQFLRGTMTTPPEQGSTGGTPKFHAIGRVSDDGNSFVWARAYCDGFLSFKGEMGYTLNGTEYVWVTNIPLTWALDMSFVCGVGTERRQYQVYSGTTLVKQWDERYANGASGTLNETQSLCGGDWLLSKGAATAGAFTLTYDGVTTGTIAVTATATTVKNALVALGKGGTSDWFVRAHPSGTGWYISPPIAGRYVNPITFTVTTALTGGTLSIAQQAPRKWGAIAQIRSGSSTPRHSGKVGGTSVTDNETPARNGSIARMSRTTASSTLGFVGTNDTSLATFWDKIDYETSDIDANTTTGTFTVKESKPYIITARVKITNTLLTNINLKLQVNGVTQQVGPAHYNTKGCGATWIQYLEAGQSVRLQIQHDGGNAGNCLAGGTTESYFSISGAG